MRKSALIVAVLAISISFSTVGIAEVTEAKYAAQIEVIEGTQIDVPIEGVTRFVIGAPNIVGAEKTDNGVRLISKRVGDTVMIVWSDAGRSVYKVTVAPVPVASLDEFVAAEPMAVQPKAVQETKTPVLKPRVIEMAAPSVEVSVEPGESHLLSGRKISRTSVSDPDVADIVPVSASEVLVNARKEGTSTVRIWDDKGLSTYVFTVARKKPTAEQRAAEVTRQIGIPGISARMAGDTVVLTGVVSSADLAQKAATIAEASGMKVVNLVTVESVPASAVIASFKAALPDESLTYEALPDGTVMIRGTVTTEEDAYRIQQIIKAWIGTSEQQTEKKPQENINIFGDEEVPADITDRAYVNARPLEDGEIEVSEEFNITQHVFGGRMPNGPRVVAIIEVNPTLARQILVSAQVIEVDRSKAKRLGIQWDEILGDNPVNPLVITEDRIPPISLDDAGPFRRNDLTASVKALIQDNAAKILSEPKLLITNGHAASILVGGELPIPVAQTSNVGSTSISVMFKPFGIQLTVRPRIADDDRIMLTLTPEVSALDFTNAVRTVGIEIPALTVRRATTTVHVGNNESLAIGGLLSSEDVKIVDRVPLLSKIPIIGELFKSRNFRNNETELIILVTPQIVERGSTVPIKNPVP